ncbi:arylsulfatase B-like isoform X2 [Chelonus insularis]|nr:arylsulfatase B-like isoform X2 [Chelonus insularis]XP_034947349.1 arylsulfatase B-like isoform X2 [Chelonus insularis]
MWIGIGFIFLCGLNKLTLAKSPHIIFILADDLGWYDVGFHGSGDIKTPNIDALAYTGVILNRYYVAPICSPSRSALMTGKYPIHTGMQHGVIMGAEPWGLSLNEKILPEYLRDLGYRNHIVGKWHLGHFKKKYTPTYRGFESHTGYWTGHHDYFDHTAVEWPYWGMDMRRNLEPAWDLHGQYSTDVFTKEAIKVIQNHNTSDPLFLYIAHCAVHSANPYNPLPVSDEEVMKFNHIKNYKRRRFAAILGKLDQSVGAIVNALRRQSMLNDSVIIFSTDNGGPAAGFNDNFASNFPLRGVKNTYWEGGVRGTGLVWYSKLSQPGRVYKQPMDITDWLPTLMTIASGGNYSSLPANLDGLDMWNALNNRESSPRRVIVHNIDDIYGAAAVTLDDWKIVKGETYKGSWNGWYGFSTWELPYEANEVIKSLTGQAVLELGFPLTPELIKRLREDTRINCGAQNNTLAKCRPQMAPCLFNIQKDPCEFNNLAVEHSEMLEKLKKELRRWNETAVPPRKVKSDPRANPMLWDHTWNNFGDYPVIDS